MMVAGSDQPIARAALDQGAREQLPSHVVGNAHHCHYHKHHQQSPSVNGNDEHERGDDDGAGECL